MGARDNPRVKPGDGHDGEGGQVVSRSTFGQTEPAFDPFDLGVNRGNGAILRNFALHERRHVPLDAAHVGANSRK